MPSLIQISLDTASHVASAGYKVVSPFVPNLVKDHVVSPTVEYATTVKKSVAENGVLPTAYTVATDARAFTLSTASTAKTMALGTASSYKAYTIDTAKWAMSKTTTTVTAMTPGPILAFVEEALKNVDAVTRDPVGVLVKPYVPAYVIHTSERTYEIVQENVEGAKEKGKETVGYVVSRVNGTVEYVRSLPRVNSVIAQLNVLTEPVIGRLHLLGTAARVEAVAPASVDVE
ncbi:hypothetical protein HDU83_001552 [Entophlyctis luteolus]|nr:hypothetical protein HDU83_001552 [Entophlyctis luteolus]